MQTRKMAQASGRKARWASVLLAALMVLSLLAALPVQAQAAGTGRIDVEKEVVNGTGSENYSYRMELNREVPLADYPVTIRWVDAGNESMRPASVPVMLYRNGALVDQASVPSAANPGSATFAGKPTQSDDGATAYTYTLEAGQIANYTLARSGPNTFTYTYVPPAPTTGTIVVRHENMQGGALAPQQTHTLPAGPYGPSDARFDAITIAGYSHGGLAAGSAQVSGTLAAGQTLTITHQYRGEGTIVIQYVDMGGVVLAPQQLHAVPEGNYGPYSPIAINNYTYDSLFLSSDPEQDTIAAGETKYIKFAYRENAKATIIVRYEDVDGNVLATWEKYTVTPGAYGPYAPVVVSGFRYWGLKVGSAQESGTIVANETKTITFVYERKMVTVIRKYHDINDGSELQAPVSDVFNYGDYYNYTSQIPIISGYDYVQTQNNEPLYGVASNDTEIVLQYRKKVQIGTIIVQYLDASSSNQLIQEDMSTYPVGAYNVTPYPPSGFVFVQWDDTSSPATGTLGADETLTIRFLCTPGSRRMAPQAKEAEEATVEASALSAPADGAAQASFLGAASPGAAVTAQDQAPAAVGTPAGSRRVAVDLDSASHNGSGLSLRRVGAGKYTFTLRHGQAFAVTGLPGGTQYKVTEISVPAAEGTHALRGVRGSASYPAMTGSADRSPKAQYKSTYPGTSQPPVTPPVDPGSSSSSTSPPPPPPPSSSSSSSSSSSAPDELTPPRIVPDSSSSQGGSSAAVAPPVGDGGGTGPAAGAGTDAGQPGGSGGLGNIFSNALTDLQNNEVPLYGMPGQASWALLNLLLALLGLLAAAAVSARLLVKGVQRRNEEAPTEEWVDPNEEETQEHRRQRAWKKGVLFTALAALAGLFSLLLFIITQDLSAPVVWMDLWTVAHAVLLAGEGVAIALLLKRPRGEDSGEDGTDIGSPASFTPHEA